MDLFGRGIFWAALYSEDDAEKMLNAEIAEYSKECADAAAQTEDCLRLSHEIEQMEANLELFANVPVTWHVEAVIEMLAGVIGLYAVFKSNALAAKIYLWAWLPRIFFGVVGEYTARVEMKQYGIDNIDGPEFVIEQLVHAVIVLYCDKVAWSFHQRLKARSGNSSSPSGDVETIQRA